MLILKTMSPLPRKTYVSSNMNCVTHTASICIMTELSAHKLDRTNYSDVAYPKDSAEGTERAKIVIPSMHLSSREASGQLLAVYYIHTEF